MSEDVVAGLIFGGLLGSMLVFIVFMSLIIYIISVIAMWKIFTKAGQKGWKALIPIYNTYISCKIIGLSFWIYVVLIPVVIGLISGFTANNADVKSIIDLIETLYMIGLSVIVAIKLGKSFDKKAGFIAGLVLLPQIFQLILAFGDSKYIGNKK